MVSHDPDSIARIDPELDAIYTAVPDNREIPMIRVALSKPNQRMLAEYLEYVLDRMLTINAPRAMLA